MAKDKSDIESLLLKDSALGKCGEVVTLSEDEAKLYEAHGFIDTNKDAVKHAKSGS
jgi:hypothetical protein